MKLIVDHRLRRVPHHRGGMGDGMMGAFMVFGPRKTYLRVISSGPASNPEADQGWEHVSVSLEDRCPSWDEMNFVKDLFWRDDELVLQFHPPRADYINHHKYVLHLWKPPYFVQLPPRDFV